MKRLFQITFIILFIAGYCFYFNRYSFLVGTGELPLDSAEHYYDYRGISNVHSNRSTGSGQPLEIIRTAQDLKIDWVILTEVNLYERGAFNEGYYNSVLALDGGLYNYLDAQILYYNIPPHQPPEGRGQAQVYFADLLSQEDRPKDTGFFALAHPLNKQYQWTGEYPDGLDGVEIINLKSVLENAWRNQKLASIWSIITYPLNPYASLLRLYKDQTAEQKLWDTLCKSKRTFGILGTDATAKAILIPGYHMKFPSYETAFSVGSNHVLLRSELTGDFKNDKEKLLTAIKGGQFYFSLDLLGNPKGFWTELRSKGKTFALGSEVRIAEDTQLVVHLPAVPTVPFEVRVLKDGELYATSNSKDTVLNLISAGVYRVVVRILVPLPFPEGKKWLPWIYANPFYVRS